MVYSHQKQKNAIAQAEKASSTASSPNITAATNDTEATSEHFCVITPDAVDVVLSNVRSELASAAKKPFNKFSGAGHSKVEAKTKAHKMAAQKNATKDVHLVSLTQAQRVSSSTKMHRDHSGMVTASGSADVSHNDTHKHDRIQTKLNESSGRIQAAHDHMANKEERLQERREQQITARPAVGKINHSFGVTPVEELPERITPPRRTLINRSSAEGLRKPGDSSTMSSRKEVLSSIPYVHENLLKSKSESLLLADKGAKQDGKYLIRTKVRKEGVQHNEFILSAVYKGKVTHHQITRSAVGKPFSLNGISTDQSTFDELVRQLQRKQPSLKWPLPLKSAVVK